MKRIAVPNRAFFYTAAFALDFFNFLAIMAEVFWADSVLHAAEFQMGLLGAIGSLGYALPCIWTGLLSERVGRRRMCLIAVAGLTMVYLITPQVRSVEALYLVSFLRSAATSFFWPPLTAWMTETSDRKEFSGVIGGYNVFWTLGIIVGFCLSGWSFQHLNPAAPFYIAAGSALLLLGALIVFRPDRLHLEVHQHDVPPHDVERFVRDGYCMIFISYFLGGLTLYLFPKVAGDSLGEQAQSLLQAVRMTGQMGIFIVLAATVVWHYKPWMVWIGLGFSFAGIATIWATESYPVYVLGFALLGMGGGIGYTLSAYYALALLKSKGLGSGIHESLIGAGALAGPLYGGQVAAMSSPRSSILAGLLPVAAVWLYMRWPRGMRRIEKKQAFSKE